MSLLAKSVFVTSCAGALGIVWYVHWKQVQDRHVLHEGIVKELERQERKKENVKNLQTQIVITKQYKEVMAAKEKEISN